MEQNLFKVIFSGALLSGVELSEAQRNVAKLFKASNQQIAAMFSGRRVVLKHGLDEVKARKYHRVLQEAGIVVQIEPEVKPEPQEQEPVFALAPVGSLMLEPQPVEKPVQYNIGYISLAPLGVDMQDVYREHAPLQLDLSHLSLC